MILLITCEISFGQDVCEYVFDVDVFDLDYGVQIDPIKKKEQHCGFWKHVS